LIHASLDDLAGTVAAQKVIADDPNEVLVPAAPFDDAPFVYGRGVCASFPFPPPAAHLRLRDG
jgi:hypothetical protein